jgi:L-idonate 5-dehydrogenase
MRFFGSAMRMPHVQGGFRRHMIVRAEQCVPVAPHVPVGQAAMTEPLAVALHALKQGGAVRGKSVLVTGAGPIGLLVLLALRHAGAGSVAVTDIVDAPLAMAARLGAGEVVNVARDRLAPPPDGEKGRFDLVFECSGNPAALASGIALARPRATIVQVGVGGAFDVPMNAVVAKELKLIGSFRFHAEFEQAAALISSGGIDVAPLITGTAALSDALAAFQLAADRSRSIKVQLTLA